MTIPSHHHFVSGCGHDTGLRVFMHIIFEIDLTRLNSCDEKMWQMNKQILTVYVIASVSKRPILLQQYTILCNYPYLSCFSAHLTLFPCRCARCQVLCTPVKLRMKPYKGNDMTCQHRSLRCFTLHGSIRPSTYDTVLEIPHPLCRPCLHTTSLTGSQMRRDLLLAFAVNHVGKRASSWQTSSSSYYSLARDRGWSTRASGTTKHITDK
jgi:hypothetical protein